MRGANVFWFLFSAGGVVVLVLAAVAWVIARPKSRAARVTLAIISVAYTIASIYSVPHALEHAIGAGFHQLTASDVPPGKTVIVLLGSGTYQREDWSGRSMSVLDPIGLERTLEAARVFRLIHPDFVISSGGAVDPEETDDAAGETMKEALLALGVPRDQIIVERKSTNTRDEAVIVAGMLPSLGVQHVVLVTSKIHMRRALGMFRAVGVEGIPAVANEREYNSKVLDLVPSQTGLRMSALVAHEVAGLAYYKLKGWYK